ncbi:nucleotidyl transferase AbiEii/AbiGii toxin family protein [Paenarthrobacter ureafaciens]|jgi:hypothetical protein|uniref:nucleotidyl transferase AbiEii/AbiGii toxin family protein n=1 Tax=Paenarthrobacter ureafaciens TaxID=37931 RepID=UPI001FB45B2E|nr:nucleotidyl transferase AbiEii/AbiGii toxin family protein [Paenarthrobacter ureafaciens]UOD82270.1 nucleotidyl transferase AbiEii/AbiGii toxin family protein [Paenarthrobacter ureafaciens]WNZ05768.1 nucleotidyl transferase AbiEii/AbiGii toxin family protein [Paenarthrobacter ureafaciens]
MSAAAPPLTHAQLEARLEEAALDLGVTAARVRRMLCTLIVSQMLPEAVAVKGGMGIKLRMGETGTRATSDLDVSSGQRGVDFEESFREQLAQGWGEVPPSKGALRKDPGAPNRVAFTAALKPQELHDPGLSRPQYVMHPYRVTLSFLGREWAAIDVEVSDPEIEPHAHARLDVDGELIELSSRFGFGELRPVQVIDLEHQIAQKIHSLTDPDYARAHDLVDLQLLWSANPDLSTVRRHCVRTFAFRRAQKWPPIPLRTMTGWNIAYGEAREETEINGTSSVLQGMESARQWLEQAIAAIEGSWNNGASGGEIG